MKSTMVIGGKCFELGKEKEEESQGKKDGNVAICMPDIGKTVVVGEEDECYGCKPFYGGMGFSHTCGRDN